MLRLDITGVTAQEATQFIVAGLQKRAADIQAQISQVTGRGQVTGRKTSGNTAPAPKTPAKTAQKGQMSPEGRARIIQAQKDRWAKKRKEAKAAAKVAPEPEPVPETALASEVA